MEPRLPKNSRQKGLESFKIQTLQLQILNLWPTAAFFLFVFELDATMQLPRTTAAIQQRRSVFASELTRLKVKTQYESQFLCDFLHIIFYAARRLLTVEVQVHTTVGVNSQLGGNTSHHLRSDNGCYV